MQEMEEMHEKNRKWIREFLAPNLITEEKLVVRKNPSESIELKSIEIKEMSLEVAYMLTKCYFVKITVQIKNDSARSKNDESEFKLVVKVQSIFEFSKYTQLNQ